LAQIAVLQRVDRNHTDRIGNVAKTDYFVRYVVSAFWLVCWNCDDYGLTTEHFFKTIYVEPYRLTWLCYSDWHICTKIFTPSKQFVMSIVCQQVTFLQWFQWNCAGAIGNVATIRTFV